MIVGVVVDRNVDFARYPDIIAYLTIEGLVRRLDRALGRVDVSLAV